MIREFINLSLLLLHHHSLFKDKLPNSSMEPTLQTMLKGKRDTFSNDDPKIKVFGVGAGGSNILSDLFIKNLQAELISLNTDWKQLSATHADTKILLGLEETRGRGAGGDALLGRAATKESMEKIKPTLEDTELVILLGALGNGTATGGIPLIAEEAKKRGALVVAFLIIPFFFKRSELEKTEEALREAMAAADTIIVLDQNRLRDLYKDLPFTESFAAMNTLVGNSINALISLIRESDLLEIDFSHLKKILSNGRLGSVGIGNAKITENMSKLLETSLNNQLYHFEPKNAKSAIVQVIGGETMTLSNLNEITSQIKQYITEDANIIIGAKIDPTMQDNVRAVVVLSGMDEKEILEEPSIRDIFQTLRISK